MKKFMRFLFFIILIALGSAVFLIGWVQLEVPTGSYGVLRSKTHGIDPELIRDGDFRWLWYKLIPTNVKICVFSLEPVNKSIQVRGELPSGAIYASFVGIGMDFSYEITGNLSFSIKPDALISLVEKQGIMDQAGLNAYTDRFANEITTFSLQKLRTYSEDEEKMERLYDLGRTELAAELGKAFPNIEHISLTIKEIRFPDHTLYSTTKSLYESYIAKQRDTLRGAVNSAAARHLESQSRYDELSKYGELFSKYPILIQYLALEQGMDLNFLKETKTEQ